MTKAKGAQVRVGGAIAHSPARRRRVSVKIPGLLMPPWSPAFARDSHPRKAPAQAAFIDMSDAEERDCMELLGDELIRLKHTEREKSRTESYIYRVFNNETFKTRGKLIESVRLLPQGK